MNIRSKLKTEVTIFNRYKADVESEDPDDFDRYGNPVVTEEELEAMAFVKPITEPAVSPEIEGDKDIIHSSFMALFAPDTDIQNTSKVEWTDHFGIFHSGEVFGEPLRIEDTHARPVVIQVHIKESLVR